VRSNLGQLFASETYESCGCLRVTSIQPDEFLEGRGVLQRGRGGTEETLTRRLRDKAIASNEFLHKTCYVVAGN